MTDLARLHDDCLEYENEILSSAEELSELRGKFYEKKRPIDVEDNSIKNTKEKENIKGCEAENRYSHDSDSFDSEILEREIIKSLNKNDVPVDDECFEEVIRIIRYYYNRYRCYFGEEHPRIKQETMDGVVERLLTGTDYIFGIDYEMYKEMIDKHFRTRYQNCNYSICHFMTEGIRNFKALETGNISGGEMMD